MTGSISDLLRQRIALVEERMQAACRRAGRERREITLVAITKTISAAIAAWLPELGLVHLGENRPQELWRKAEVLPKMVHWHLVGHLQRNKIDRSLPLVHLIHSVDSLRLLEALERAAAQQGRIIPVLLEVNASREAQKHGFGPEVVPELIPKFAAFQHVHLAGMMTMAALEEDPERCRPAFALVRRLRERMAEQLGPPHSLHQLSMGMSNDFEIAIEEGATLVRIGTALFEGIPKDQT
jgi:pyridoxal phosphate enzyme (YggS family)